MLDSRFVSHLSLHLAHAGFNLAEAQPVLIADGYSWKRYAAGHLSIVGHLVL